MAIYYDLFAKSGGLRVGFRCGSSVRTESSTDMAL
jgi:hypothetical protein